MSFIKNVKQFDPIEHLARTTAGMTEFDNDRAKNLEYQSHDITLSFIKEMRCFLEVSGTNITYKSDPKDLTRTRYFSFKNLAIAILKEHTRPIQTKIKHLFSEGAFGEHLLPPSASAFSQARLKLLPIFFKDWTYKAINYFYMNYPKGDLVDTWKGRTIKAIDGSKFILPDTPETRSVFSVTKNQFPNSQKVFSQVSLLFDVLNGIPIDACLDGDKSEIDYVINSHYKHIQPNDVVIYDRGYASYAILVNHVLHGGDFVIRVPKSNTFTVAQEFLESAATDILTTIKIPHNLKPQGTKLGWPKSITARLVKVSLDDGTIEVLLTSLLDQSQYPAFDFKWLYFKRWSVETAFDKLKNLLEAECFGSKKIHNILQEFHAMIFTMAFEAIANKLKEHEIRMISKKKD